jgi:uncharacterized protein (DUF1501 family)
MLNRRLFLKSGSMALAGFALRPSLAFSAAAKDQPIVVVVFQRGAADGVSMVVPFGDSSYYSLRPQIAIGSPARNAEGALDLDGFFGFHPALHSLKPIYDEGHLAIIHAVGSSGNTRSHFDAQDYMESGTPGNKSVMDGWMNRYLQSKPAGEASPFRAVAFSANMPRSLMGPAPAVAMTRISDFGLRAGSSSSDVTRAFEEMYGHAETGKETFEALEILKKARPQQLSPSNGAVYPGSSYGQALMQIGQLIKSDVGIEMAFADIGGWDTHANQGNERGQLSNRLREFGEGLAAFYRDLGDRMRNIVVITMTEFGRSIRQNGSGGTDHGHASVSFVFGGPVKGGKVYGRWPGLSSEQLFEGRDLALTTDYRQVVAEVLRKHSGARDLSRVFPGFTPSSPLGLI